MQTHRRSESVIINDARNSNFSQQEYFRRSMRKISLLFLLCLALGISSAWASTGSINANDFQDPVNWCTNYGCNGAQFGTPQNWLSNGGRTGQGGLVRSPNFYKLVQGEGWEGDIA